MTALRTLVDEVRLQHVVLVAAANYCDLLDKAAVREGRFDYGSKRPIPTWKPGLESALQMWGKYANLMLLVGGYPIFAPYVSV